MKTVQNGKGDRRRPQFVDEDELEMNWVRAFRREKKNIRKMKGYNRKNGENTDT